MLGAAKLPLTEVEAFPGPFLPRARGSLADLLFPGERGVEIVPMDSGKAAICALLAYFHSTGRLEGRSSQVLFPQWLGDWVYCVSLRHCIPESLPSPGTRGVLVYHQYGYPQRMDVLLPEARRNGWFVIEDCAHAIRSRLDGGRLGLLGDAGVLSFSKFFPTLTGGAVVTRDPAIAGFCRNLGRTHSRLTSSFSLFAQWAHSRPWLTRLRGLTSRMIEMGYSSYELGTRLRAGTLRRTLAHLEAGMLDARDRNRDFLVSGLRGTGLVEPLEHSSVTPYVLPIFAPRARLERISSCLASIGVAAGIYRFDLNRNLMNPDFQPCVRLPVHPGVTSRVREKMLAAVRECL